MYKKQEQESLDLNTLNAKAKVYRQLSPEERRRITKAIMKEVKRQQQQFLQRLQKCKAQLKKLNLILGATGAGKSTTFNFINQYPLIITEGVKRIVNSSGKQEVQKTGLMKLKVDEDWIKKHLDAIIAPIGQGFISETTIPNFCKSKNQNVTYVDCAGQFDNKDIVQSIANSFFKYQLAKEAEYIKLTLVINYSDIISNRGTIFKKILEQVGKFIGLWDQFCQSQSISLILTNVPTDDDEILQKSISLIHQISVQVKDLGPFAKILANIAQRKAVAIFLAPQKQISNYQQMIASKGKIKPKYMIPEGKPYEPNNQICSPEIITKRLQKTKFMKNKENLFIQNLQHNAQVVVNEICEQTIQDMKQQVLNLICLSFKDINPSNIQSEKKTIQKKLNKVKECKKIEEIINQFCLNANLQNYKQLEKDLNEWYKISNISNIDEKLSDVSRDIQIYLSDRIHKLNAQEILNMQKKAIQIQKQNQRLLQQNKSKKLEHERQMAKLQAQAELQTRKLQHQANMRAQQIKLQQQTLKLKSKEQRNRMKLQMQRQQRKEENEIRKMQMQQKIKKQQGKSNLQLKKYQMSTLKQQNAMKWKMQQKALDHQLEIKKQEADPLNKFLNVGLKAVEAVVDNLNPIGGVLKNIAEEIFTKK